MDRSSRRGRLIVDPSAMAGRMPTSASRVKLKEKDFLFFSTGLPHPLSDDLRELRPLLDASGRAGRAECPGILSRQSHGADPRCVGRTATHASCTALDARHSILATASLRVAHPSTLRSRGIPF